MAQTANARISDQNLGGSGSAEESQEKFGIQYYQTVSWNLEQIAAQEIYSKGDPCSGKGALGDINTNINKLFVVLRGVQKYGNFYINGAINKVQNLKNTISSVTSAIAGVLKSLVQRLRNWVLNKLKSLIIGALELIMTNFLRTIKESIVSAVIDQIFCSFEKIISGLFGLVGDFLYSLVGQVVQTPFCAAERFANALINRLVNDIDNALAPIFDNINDILGGVGTIFGSVSSAINFILGFQGFLCGGPECPEIKEFSLSPWGGPTKSQKDNFNNFNFGISDSFAGEITDSADDWLSDFFGEDSAQAQSPGQCYTGNFECGLPQVIIFGGGGSGAVAQAVVNNVGQVVGTNLVNGGSGYTSPPFVQIVDPAGCGANASGFASLEVDNDGYETGGVGGITITNPGTGYDDTFIGGNPSITSFIGAPNPIVVNNSITLTWNVINADTVELLGYDEYTDLPLAGSLSVPIMENDVNFGPQDEFTTKQFTLRASKSNTNSSDQVTESNFVATVLQDGESGTVNSEPPTITQFTVDDNSVTPGQLITFQWQTTNAEQVSLSNVDNGDSLPLNGTITSTIPTNLNFPSNGSGVSITYTLTAQNDNGIVSQGEDSQIQTVTSSVTVVVTETASSDDGADIDDGTGGNGGTGDGDGDGDGTGGDSGTGDGDGTDTDGGGTGGDGTGTDGDGDGTGGGTGGGDGTGDGDGNNSVAIIDGVDIINTGIGYTGGDTLTTDDDNGGTFVIDTNQLGQIVNVTVTQTGYGYTRIPTGFVSSLTGVGAEFRIKLRFIPVNEFLRDNQLQVIDPNKLVRVVDCIGNRVPSQSINT